MAPRGRRKRRSEDDMASQEPSELSSNSLEPSFPFFDTSFSTHRVSPLYLGAKPLDRDRFEALAKRLRDLLVGDVVRGVEVGLDGDDGVMARAGALEAVDFGCTSLCSIVGIDPDMVDDTLSGVQDERTRQPEDISSRQALHISLRYESVLCTAVLLPQLESTDTHDLGGDILKSVDGPDIFDQVPPVEDRGDREVNGDHFCSLPLLLFRMPAPLRSIVVDFISRTFDCRISPLRLGTQTLLSNLERWTTITKLVRGPAASRDVVITLGFSLPTHPTSDMDNEDAAPADLGLKTLDVIIEAPDLERFRQEGTKRKASDAGVLSTQKSAGIEPLSKRKRVDDALLEEGWSWRHKNPDGTAAADDTTTTTASYPLTEALGSYLDEHLALNLFDARTKITKVACGGFVMSGSRLKLFSMSERRLDGEAARQALVPHARFVLDCLGNLLRRATSQL